MGLILKVNHKPVRQYYAELEAFDRLGVKHEMAVKTAFQHILEHCCKQAGWTLEPEYKIKIAKSRSISVDGGLVDQFRLPHAYWEAKDSQDDLSREVERKFALGYPRNNIVFQAPTRAILWQGGIRIYDEDITRPEALVSIVTDLFAYRSESQANWEKAIDEFKPRIPEVAREAIKLIERERKENPRFIKAFCDFAEVCKNSINPNLSDSAIEEMLVQHLLTERIFRRVFHNSDFTDRNIIAREIEGVVSALTARKFSKEDFLKPLDHFYGALEQRASSLNDYSQQQAFINTVYEKFFQGFAVKVADTHGIVYTPQPIVDFMVRSVEEILKKEFGRSLSDEGVHIIDPFVGTGNFITRIMREIKKTALPHKYAGELHCNEVMLLPYYVASMNIEHEYYERTDQYKPFEGICLVDTFELAEDKQLSLMFTQENTERVEKLKNTKLFVIIGNPPYNTAQMNENDNNKNRKYKTMDARVAETYSADSNATLRSKLSDPYVKAIRWASDKIVDNGEGIVAFVSNNSFIDNIAFDGMRKHLASDFSKIYVLNLKGNARTSGERRQREKGNIFDDTIRVGISIAFFVKKRDAEDDIEINLFAVDDFLTSDQKRLFLETQSSWQGIEWGQSIPDQKHTWLTEGLSSEFEGLLPLGTRETKKGVGEAIFRIFSVGVVTARDSWAYNFDHKDLCTNMARTIEFYNDHTLRWSQFTRKPTVDDFVVNDDTRISWSDVLKLGVTRAMRLDFDNGKIRTALYRPFVMSWLYFDQYLTQRRYQMPRIFPTSASHSENLVICVTGVGSRKPFQCLMTNLIPDFHSVSDTQCFPFYVYDEDGSNRRENVTDWAVEQFSAALSTTAEKLQIFYYTYGLLHSPEYREKYQANLRRDLPRIPLPKSIEDFRAFVSAGERLAALHVNYGGQQEFPLEKIENPNRPLNWRLEKMKLTKDKTTIIYNEFLALAGIPPDAFNFIVRNKSPLEWIIDRYQVRKDKRSGIVNDPNRADDPQYIVKLIGKVITVSLETMKIIKGLPKI